MGAALLTCRRSESGWLSSQQRRLHTRWLRAGQRTRLHRRPGRGQRGRGGCGGGAGGLECGLNGRGFMVFGYFKDCDLV